MRIAIVGSGISGLAAAWLLSRKHDVELFERDDRPGGHAHTHRVTRDGVEYALDTGFLVYNERTYPNFVRLLRMLGVEGQKSDMSFGVRCRRCGLEYSTRTLAAIFAQRRRLLDPGHWWMLADIPRFNRHALRALGEARPDRSLGEFLDEGHYSVGFLRHFLLPLGGAIWSAAVADIRAFSARSFLTFFSNHGWLSLYSAPQWWTVKGGSRAYVDAIARALGPAVRLRMPVAAVRRDPAGVVVRTADRFEARYDKVVLATHADEALALLENPTEEEMRILSCFRYSRNPALLHTDTSLLPTRHRARASWNCDLANCHDESEAVHITYHLNRLQSQPGPTQFCVSLNRAEAEGSLPTEGTVLARMAYTHPVMDRDAVIAQGALKQINGKSHTFFCGAHLGWGFHEDGLNSALAVAAKLGVTF